MSPARGEGRTGLGALGAALGALAVAPALVAQTSSPPVFPTEAGLVTVDVVVTDGHGAPVRGLGQEDFVVSEDGAPQTLQVFEAIDRAVPRGATPEAPAPGRRESVSTNARPEGRARPALLIIFDELHLSPASVEPARRRLREMDWGEALGGADVYLASAAGGAVWAVSLPEDADGFRAALERFRARRSPEVRRMTDYEAFLIAARHDERTLVAVYRRYLNEGFLVDPNVPGYQPQRAGQPTDAQRELPPMGRSAVQAEAELRWRDVRVRRTETLRRLTRLLRGLAGSPGRKAILLVSEGFVLDSAESERRELVEAAREARASLYLVDPRQGLGLANEVEARDAIDIRDSTQAALGAPRDAEGTEAVVYETGGQVLRSLPSLGEALRAIGAELRTYYLLGYSPPSGRADGRYHRLKVEVRREGLRISARPGYYALPPLADRRPSEGASALLAGLDSPVDTSGLPARLAGYVLGSGADGTAVVLLVAEVDVAAVAAQGEEVPVVDAVFQLARRDRGVTQQAVATARVTAESGRWLRLASRFEAQPGAYQGRVFVRERGGAHLTGSVRNALTVLPPEAFRITSPILSDTLNAQNVALPRAERRFRGGSTLYCLVEVLGSSSRVQAGMDVRSESGRILLRVPPSSLSGPHLSREWAVPLQDLPPGPYDLWISVTDSERGQGLQARERFEVIAKD
jgi:VWFA-related protein